MARKKDSDASSISSEEMLMLFNAGKSPTEIGKIAGISRQAVRARLMRLEGYEPRSKKESVQMSVDAGKKRRGGRPKKENTLVGLSVRVPRDVKEYFVQEFGQKANSRIREILGDWVNEQKRQDE